MKINNATPEVITHHAISGSFGKISYFLTTVDLRDAAENLQLLPQDNLSFKERIQRVLHEDRVRDEILPYLKSNSYRFFNSLVCVLLPDSNQQDGYWEFTPYTDAAEKPISNLGRLSIAKRVARVVLDGQHRYRALQLYWESEKAELALREKIDVPVAYVVIDSLGQFGQRSQDFRSKTTEAVRNLFTVLNKNAKLVDKTTLLLIDDSDITNVMARKLLEDQVVEERLVKWYAGDSLNPNDPYFMTLHTVREIVRAFLVNQKNDWEPSEGVPQQDLINRYYVEGFSAPFGVRETVQIVFQHWAAYSDWKTLLQKLGIEIPPQPLPPELTKSAKQRLETERKAQLSHTVAGQRAVLKAIATTFLNGTSRSKHTLVGILERLNTLYRNGLLSRKHTKDSPNVFRSVLFDEAGRMIWANSSVELSRKIIAVGLGAGLDRKTIETEYSAATSQSKELLQAYWAKCDELLKQA